MVDSDYWARYYEVTVERPAWETVRIAIERFRAEDAALAASGATPPRRLAVDLGCGAGRDARELLRAGWRVLAIDRELAAVGRLAAAAGPDLGARLQTRVEDLATVEIPPCDLVNASLCLPFLASEPYAVTWQRIASALEPGSRFAAMLFGDRDESASDETMTCRPPERIRADLAGFEIEHWHEKEEESQTALGEAHHFHLVEFVARKVR
ncbi:MAG: class I SAM-dependent methyltransferase [Candidatus Limnocylindrales bacterium]|jgi:SAM-dependent methyltransferase